MQFDPQIVSHAQAFVNARRKGKRARVPAMQLRQWPFFIALVNAGLGHA
ncbi:succinate dehydrogenase flavoprotein subunit [Pantoea ananatis]|nr:succinate dehydrogenase flavoprotein subunit [Pantoea ananatis]MCH9271811.1 succinate dehydrogenase flavoprotein subunit [Pantoea ananatis]